MKFHGGNLFLQGHGGKVWFRKKKAEKQSQKKSKESTGK